jgi:hypothetical protein
MFDPYITMIITDVLFMRPSFLVATLDLYHIWISSNI